MLAAHCVLHGRARGLQPVLEHLPQFGRPRTVLPHSLQELVHERDMQHGRERGRGSPGRTRGLECGEAAVRSTLAASALQQLIGQAAQVLDQRQLQHAGPRPQLPDAQRRDALIGVHEAIEALGIEARVAETEQRDRHGVDARGARQLARRELGQLQIVGRREMALDLAHLALDQMKVVEQPFRCGRGRLATTDIGRERAIGQPQPLGVSREPAVQLRRAAARVPRQCEARGERSGPFLEPLDAEQLTMEGIGVQSDELRLRPARWRTHGRRWDLGARHSPPTFRSVTTYRGQRLPSAASWNAVPHRSGARALALAPAAA